MTTSFKIILVKPGNINAHCQTLPVIYLKVSQMSKVCKFVLNLSLFRRSFGVIIILISKSQHRLAASSPNIALIWVIFREVKITIFYLENNRQWRSQSRVMSSHTNCYTFWNYDQRTWDSDWCSLIVYAGNIEVIWNYESRIHAFILHDL